MFVYFRSQRVCSLGEDLQWDLLGSSSCPKGSCLTMRAHRSQFSFPTASALWIRFFFGGTINFCHENPIQITGHLRLRSFCVFPPPPSICRCHTAASITSKVGDFDQTSSSSECALLLASNSSQFGANIWSNVANLNVKTALKPTWWPHDLRFSSSKDVPPSHDDTS